MSIIPRPLKQVLGKIIPFSQADKIPTFNLGSGTADSTTYLRGDGTWSSVTGSASNKMYTVGRNSTGSTLYKGTIVYISGSTGNRPNFVKAQANSEATSAGTFGVIEADILNNSDGNCVTIGTIDNLDTRTVATHPFTDVTLSDGDTIYLHPTIAGYITNVKPSAPNHLVYVGKVVRTHPTLGTIVYRIQNGYEIDELHDVAISSPTNGQILQYESATSLWKNVTPSSGGLTVGTTSITSGTAGRVLFEDATNKLNESANFYWDNTNSRLSIGQGSSPGARLDIRAAGTATTDLALRIRNSADTFDLFKANGLGCVWSNGVGGASGSTAFGENTLSTRTTGTANTAFGDRAGNILTTGSNNTFVGYRAGGGVLASSFTGSDNTIVGAGAGLYLSSGIQNTFIGNNAGTSITTGSYNTIIGMNGTSFPTGFAQNIVISDGSGAVGLWKNSSHFVGFGYAPATDTLGAKVDIKAQGALSTDLAFRVRNSANTANLFSVQGDGIANVLTRLNVGFQGMTTTGGALYVYAGNSSDYMSRFYNTIGNPCVDFRTNSDGGEIYLRDNSGNISLTLSGRWSNAIDFANSKDIGFGTSTGTKIGYATNQKLAFWNATPIIQPTTAIAASTFVSNTSLIANDTATFDGYTIGQVVKALRNIGILA